MALTSYERFSELYIILVDRGGDTDADSQLVVPSASVGNTGRFERCCKRTFPAPVVYIDAVAPSIGKPSAAVLLVEGGNESTVVEDLDRELNTPSEVERYSALFCATPAAPPTFVRLIMSSQLFLRHARLSPSFPFELF